MKVAIVCGAPSSEFLAPYDDDTWEIWVLGNRLERHIDKRVTRVFEVHDNLTEHHDPQKYAQRLVDTGLPLIVGEKFPLLEAYGVMSFPYSDAKDMYGSEYLTSSPAYMIAYALLMDATEIALYGVDLSVDNHEYFWQRPCVEAWIGFAKGRGVKFFIPEVSHVGKCSYVEGRDWNGGVATTGPFSEGEFLKLASEHVAKIDELQALKKEITIKIAAHDGAQQVYQKLAKAARAVEGKVDIKSLSEVTLIR